MKMYVYSLEDKEHVATITGESNDACDEAFNYHFDINDYAATYSPAFGLAGGLDENPDADEIDASEFNPVAAAPKIRTSIKSVSHSVVDIRFADSFTGELREYRLHARPEGGYVRYGSEGKHICERLSRSGPTLTWSGEKPLVDLIRREYRAMRRADKAYESR